MSKATKNLAAEVAEKVMGWKVWKHTMKLYDLQPNDCFFSEGGTRNRWTGSSWVRWEPDADWNHMAEVLAKLRAYPKINHIWLQMDGASDGCAVSILVTGRDRIVEGGNSLPLAVCLAALKAVQP